MDSRFVTLEYFIRGPKTGIITLHKSAIGPFVNYGPYTEVVINQHGVKKIIVAKQSYDTFKKTIKLADDFELGPKLYEKTPRLRTQGKLRKTVRRRRTVRSTNKKKKLAL